MAAISASRCSRATAVPWRDAASGSDGCGFRLDVGGEVVEVRPPFEALADRIDLVAVGVEVGQCRAVDALDESGDGLAVPDAGVGIADPVDSCRDSLGSADQRDVGDANASTHGSGETELLAECVAGTGGAVVAGCETAAQERDQAGVELDRRPLDARELAFRADGGVRQQVAGVAEDRAVGQVDPVGSPAALVVGCAGGADVPVGAVDRSGAARARGASRVDLVELEPARLGEALGVVVGDVPYPRLGFRGWDDRLGASFCIRRNPVSTELGRDHPVGAGQCWRLDSGRAGDVHRHGISDVGARPVRTLAAHAPFDRAVSNRGLGSAYRVACGVPPGPPDVADEARGRRAGDSSRPIPPT
jgi:hypothetical protein